MQSVLSVIFSVALNGLLDQLGDSYAVFGMNAFEEALESPGKRTGGAPVDLLHVFRPLHFTCYQVTLPCANLGSLQAEPSSLFCFSQTLFHFLAFLDVYAGAIISSK